MKKILAVSLVLALALFASTYAVAQEGDPSASATISVLAVVPETASLSLSTNSVSFKVLDPTNPTAGFGTPIATASGNWKKGTTASLWISSTDLTGGNGGGTIPVASVQYKWDSGSFAPLSGISTSFKSYVPATAGQQSFNTNLAFQLNAVPNAAADAYTGTVTLTLQVL